MITRRTFVGSLVAACTLSGVSARLMAKAPGANDRTLDWHCDIIPTLRQNNRQRASIVTGVSIQPGGGQIAVVGDDHYVSIFERSKNRFTHHLGMHTDWVRSARYSPDGKMLATAGNDRKLILWNPDNFNVQPIKHPHGHAIIDIAFSSDSSQLATVGFSSELRIFDLQSGSAQTYRCDCPDNHAVAFSADDQWIAVGGRSGMVQVWDVGSGQLVQQLRAHKQRIRCIQFTSTGDIVSCGDDQIVRISNIQTGQSRVLPRHAAKLYCLALLTDNLLATSGSDNRIHIWQLSTTRKLGTLDGHTGTVSCLDVAGNRIASGGFDTDVRVWHFDPNFDPEFRETRQPGRQLG